MDFLEGSSGAYRPIKVLFDTPIYDRALQLCWNISSYKSQIAMLLQLLKLQQKNQIPSQVTVEDMINLLQEKSENSLRERLWQFELEGYDEEDAKPLLKLMWAVNISNKRRDVEFEAQMLLNSPEALPANFQNPQVFSLGQKYAKTLRERQQEAPRSGPLSPQEVVIEVVPRVLQGFWVLPPRPLLNMPSQRLSKMSVGVTKAVLDRVSAALPGAERLANFSRSIRDDMVRSILTKIRQMHTSEILVKRLNSFSPVQLTEIVDVAVEQICGMFQPLSPEVPAHLLTPTAEPPATPVHEDAEREQPASRPDRHSVVSPPPAPQAPRDDPPSVPAGRRILRPRRRKCAAAAAVQTETHDVTVGQICGMFQPQSPKVPAHLTPTANPPATPVQEDAEREQPASRPDRTSAVSPPSAPLALPAEPLSISMVQAREDENTISSLEKRPVEFVEGSRGVYRPIMVLFDTPIYDRALQLCWNISSYKSQIAMLFELLKLQQKNQIPSQVTVEDMVNLLQEKSENSLRERLWQFELEGYDEEDAKPLLKLMWAVNISNKRRDVEFEAQMLLNSPEALPANFQNPQVFRLGQKYAKTLRERQQEAPRSGPLSPQEVVIEVVPRVLQGFWVLPPRPLLNMPSQRLSKMSVGVTKAVLDRVSAALPGAERLATFSRSIRDDMVMSILTKIRQMHTSEILVKRLNSFSPVQLTEIVDVAVEQICGMFQPLSPEVPAHLLTPTAEPPATPVHEDAEREQPASRPDRHSVVSPPPAPQAPRDDPPSVPAGRRILRPRRRKCAAAAAVQTETHDVTVGQICGMFQPQSPKVPAHLTPTANPPATPVQEDAEREQPASRPDRTSAVSPPSAPLALPAEPSSISMVQAREDENTISSLEKRPVEFVEGSRGVYRPIMVLFDTPIYDRALQLCWNISSYKSQIAMLFELLKLQQKNLIPSQVTVEDMVNLLQEKSENSLRERLWQFELEGYDEEDAKPLLKLMWAVNISNKRRDVEFEAQMLLNSPEALPANFQNPQVFSLGQKYAKTLRERQQEAPRSGPLSPQEVVIEVVPRVLQGFWVLPPRPLLNMPSQRLSKMSVGVTKAVLDRVSAALPGAERLATFSRSFRDDMVMSILTKIRQMHTSEILVKRLNSFSPVQLTEIVDVAVEQICGMFQPLSPEVPAHLLTPTAEPPATPVHEDAEREQPASRPDRHSVVSPPPAPQAPRDDPPSVPAGRRILRPRRRKCAAAAAVQTETHDVTVGQICGMFQPQSPKVPAHLTPTANPPATPVQEDAEREQPASRPDRTSAVSPPSAPLALPAEPSSISMVQAREDENTISSLEKRPVEFVEGSRGVYRPIMVLFDTPIYDRALQLCWNISSYKSQIAMLFELLKLQQKNLIPSQVTVEDMVNLLQEKSENSLRERLWQFELEGYDEEDAKPLLKLMWAVNISNKRRDVEFEAQMLLNSPEALPANFQNPQVFSLGQKYAKTLRERQQEAPRSGPLSPQEVVIEVVPRVLQGFWVLPPRPLLNMPSQRLSRMSVGVTKAVLDRVSAALPGAERLATFSRSIRDDMVMSILTKIRQMHTSEILVKRLNSFSPVQLTEIVDVAVEQICGMFQPLSPEVPAHLLIPTAEPPATPVHEDAEREQPASRPDRHPVVSPPPAPQAPRDDPPSVPAGRRILRPRRRKCAAAATANPPATSPVQEDSNPAERLEPEPSPTRTSAVVSPPPAPMAPSNEPPAIPATPRILRPRRRKCATAAALQTETHETQ